MGHNSSTWWRQRRQPIWIVGSFPQVLGEKRQKVFETTTEDLDSTVDGSEIRLTSWYGKWPIIYMVLYIPGSAGFLPSTVSLLPRNYTWGNRTQHTVFAGLDTIPRLLLTLENESKQLWIQGENHSDSLKSPLWIHNKPCFTPNNVINNKHRSPLRYHKCKKSSEDILRIPWLKFPWKILIGFHDG